MKIEELLTRPEGKTLEFKRDLSSPKNVLKTLTAFANTAGGILLVLYPLFSTIEHAPPLFGHMPRTNCDR